MSRFSFSLVLVLIGGGVTGFACGKSQKANDGGPGEEVVTTPPEVFGKTTFNPQLAVIDQAGHAIANATVVFGNVSVRSKDDGIATLPEQPIDKTTVVTVNAEGFAPSTRTLSVSNAYTPLPVELAKLLDFTLDAETGGAADLGAAQVRLPGRGFLRPDGSQYTGPVTVKSVTVFDASSGSANLALGERRAAGATADQTLELFSAIHVELKAADGATLRFAAGDRAVVSFSLPKEGGHEVGQTLALYNLDEKTGLWQESSSCIVRDVSEPGQDRKLACVGDVEHFSIWAVGRLHPAWNFCRKFVLKATKAFPAAAPLKAWYIDDRQFGASAFECERTNAAPLGVCTVRSFRAVQREKVWLDAMVATRWFRNDQQYLRIEVPGSYDRTCPETNLYYNPVSRTLGLEPPPDKMSPIDKDDDGYFAKSGDRLLAGEDCDDDDKANHPGARPIACTGKDHDCDGSPDVARMAPSPGALSDGHWNEFCVQTKLSCSSALGAEAPGNSRDEDCDGFVSDSDGDGYFRRTDPLFAGSGKAADCNDYSAAAHPGGTEVKGNLIDEDCDGIAADQDGDGFPSVKQLALEGKSQTTTEVDCNDLDKEARPGSAVKDLPVLAQFYEGNRRKADFCSLFGNMGRPSAKLLNLFYVADRNCNGVLEDLDGDGKMVAAAGLFTNTPPYDANDLDPRIQTRDQSAMSNDSMCAPDLSNFGTGVREVCPRLFNREQQCVETYDQDLKPTGEFACGSPDWAGFAIPPTPFGFSGQYGPCSTMVLPACGSQLLCGGPIDFADWYQQALKNYTPTYDITAESFTGFCMPACDEVK